MLIRKIKSSEKPAALELVLSVFMKYEAPDYSEEGVKTFQDSVMNNSDYLNAITIYGAYENGNIIGVIATRNEGNHIALFFVDSKYHRSGVGRKLFELVLKNSTTNEITVNSSPYAVEVYHHLGFIDSDAEQITDGMRYTPMVYKKF